MQLGLAEYIWIDGSIPTRQLRSKARVVHMAEAPAPEDFPEWSFDGSSTMQATGHDSDCILRPVRIARDPLRGPGNFLVMCEVFDPNGVDPHMSNSRAQLREVLDAGARTHEPWIGFEQEYTMFHHRNPLGWPDDGFPAPQGPYYCGVGAREVFGRRLADAHAKACLDAGLMYYGLNAEVMPGQWEFQIGYRGIEGEPSDPLTIADHTWIARYLLRRIGEDLGIHASFDNKPIKGDWNGAGMHTNFSTRATRRTGEGIAEIEGAVRRLAPKHQDHIALYGHGLAERLTGAHETCAIDQFRHGAADRGASIRIPRPVVEKGCGYFEDRRPGANADPYLVAARICATVCGVEDAVMRFRTWPRAPQLVVAAE